MNDKRSVLMFTIVFTLVMGALIFFVYNFNVPNPNMILIAALVLSTSIGGGIPGAICAVMMMGYSLFFFSTDHSFVRFTDVNIHKIAVIALGIVINYFSVAMLKRGRDKAGSQLKSTNDELLMTNEQLEQTNAELKQVNELLKSMASKDSLTNLRNRYALRQDFEMYVGLPLHVLFLDLDDFKAMNDTKGHAYGDKVLSIVGKVLTESFRTSNCYRYGGDEFLIISENESDEEFLRDCDAARNSLDASQISFSGGYVVGVPETVPELRNMVMQADEMLYEAKKNGKDRFKGTSFDPQYVPGQEAVSHHKSHIRGNGSYSRS